MNKLQQLRELMHKNGIGSVLCEECGGIGENRVLGIFKPDENFEKDCNYCQGTGKQSGMKLPKLKYLSPTKETQNF